HRALHSFPTRRSSDLTGPPRSSSQYHSANTTTLVSQIAPPRSSSGPAPDPSVPRTNPTINRPAESRLAALNTATSDVLAIRNRRSEEHTSELQSPYDL